MRESIEKLGCFVTGFNYQILKSCSEVAKKMLKRYTGLLILISIVWSVIGYCFATRYLKTGVLGGIMMSIIAVLSVIMIERNIILAQKSNKGMYVFRIILASVMAIIGSLIIDQIMFSEDIEEHRIIVIQDKVNKNFPKKSLELKNQIIELNTQILSMEERQRALSEEVALKPMIPSRNVTITQNMRPGDSIAATNKVVNTTDIPNPKINELNDLQDLLGVSYRQRQQGDSLLLALRADLQKEYQDRRGFLEELTIMREVISKSWVSMAVYIMWFLFFLAIELFIVFSKLGETENDYHKLIQQQMDLHNRRLDLLDRT